MRRHLIVLLAALVALGAALGLTACGGSGGSSGGGTSATPTDGGTVVGEGEAPEGAFDQLRFVLAKFPYRPWYRACLVREVEAQLSAGELEELAELPDAQARRVALRFALGASPECERKGREPIDPGASKVEVSLLRLGYATTLEALGRKEGLNVDQSRCLSQRIARFDDSKVIELGNADEMQREKILVGVIEGCTS
jgi:hypothetical protein